MYYRAHCQDYGWLDWAKSGEKAGSEGYSRRMEGIEIRLVKKGEKTPETGGKSFLVNTSTNLVSYKTYVEGQGWTNYVTDGRSSGTVGESKKLEGISIRLSSGIDGTVQYKTYTENDGWEAWSENGEINGEPDGTRRLEAIQIRLTGEAAEKYDIYYRVHCQDDGWLGWAKNGEKAGSEGYSRRMEAIEIRLVAKGQSLSGGEKTSFAVNLNSKLIYYRTYVEKQGWTNCVTDGRQSGTVGESKKLEGIRVRLSSGIDGTVQYRTYTENDGWEAWSENGEINWKPDGTRRLEAIQIRLTGEAAEKYDIYYRVHCQDYGWLGWAKNGEKAGSEGYSRRMEAMEVRLVTKGNAAPGNTNNCFYGR